jgi:glycosyltransferase involved in cell wall biosynthesis
MPSLYEGFGLPVLEAMSCGCPVVTSKEGSLAEVAGDAAKIIDPHSVDSIAQGMNEILGNLALRKELSQKGLIQSKEFTWNKMAKKTMDVYKSIASK